ncbi:UNVERIFIED_CONTAM: hypothetical protein K2H54_035576 [Gekko kuhli]
MQNAYTPLPILTWGFLTAKDRRQVDQDTMVALRPCSLLLLLVLACTLVGTEADYAIETFKRQYIDYPWTLKTQDPKYCDMTMKERGFTRQKFHVFVHAAFETILAACISRGVQQTSFRIIGDNVVATLCVADKVLPSGSYDDYKRGALLRREAVYCDNGVPLYPLAPFKGKRQ